MDAVWVFVHGKCAVLGMMVGCGASALESVLVAGGRVRPKGGRVTHGGSSPFFVWHGFVQCRRSHTWVTCDYSGVAVTERV